MLELESKIYHEQIRLIYNQGPILIAGSTLCALLISVFLWRQLPHLPLVIWLMAIGVATLLRLWCMFIYRRSTSVSKERKLWGPLFWLGTLITGIIWGIWPLMFYSLYSTEYLLLISTIFAGMVAVSAASGSIFLPSFLSFSVPLVVPLAVIHLVSDNDSLILTGILLLMFLLVNFFLAIRGNRQFRQLLRTQFKNDELLQKLAEEKGIAERAVIAKSRFLAAASHDLRQPLHAMGLFLSTLRQRETEPKKLEIIDDMSKSSKALNGLFNSLLDMSRLDAEIIDFNPSHITADDVFNGLRVQFMHQAADKGIQLLVDAKEHVFYTDAILLERVLRNLLSNAVQYTEVGLIRLSCEDHDDGSMLIVLEDTGIGIPQENKDAIFSEYYQINNGSGDRAEGLGLGLAIVRRLCELMDIPLSMQSVEGLGTVFKLIVPGGDEAQVRPKEHLDVSTLAKGRKVLVIDDEVQVLQGMRHLLESWGCEVMLAESARDALKIIALTDEVPDMIVSDFRLRSNRNGIDAVAAICEALDRQVPAIIISGDTSPERLKHVKSTGLMFLHKPVSANELHQRMSLLIEDSSSVDRKPTVTI